MFSRILARFPSRLAYPMNRLIQDVLVPDQYPEWTRAACRAAQTLKDIDVVWVTGGPFGIFIAGAAVAQSLGVPLVLDYRDPWTVTAAPRRTLFHPRKLGA